MRHSTLILQLALITTLAMLAACSSNDLPPAPAQPTAAAPAATAETATPGRSAPAQPAPAQTAPAAAAPTVEPVRAGQPPIVYGSPLFPMPAFPVQGAQPAFLAFAPLADTARPGLALVMSNYGQPATAWLWPTLDGEPAQPRQLSLGGAGTPFPLLGDYDEDGLADLAALSDSGIDLLLSGRGEPFTHLDRQGPASGVASGDFDGDGHLDLIASFTPNYSGHQVELLLGDGQGNLGGAASGFTLALTGAAPALAVADFDRDRSDDLAVVDDGANRLTLFFGGAEPLQRSLAFDPFDDRAASLAAGDLTGDGLADLALFFPWGAGGSAYAQLWPGTGDPAAPFDPPQQLAVPGALEAVQTGDFDSDGRLDLLFLPRYTAGSYLLLLNAPDQTGGDWPGWRRASLPVAPLAGQLALGDSNGDSFEDLAALIKGGGAGQAYNLMLLPGIAGGWIEPTRLSATANVWAVAAADFDGDGRADLAVARSPSAPDQAWPHPPNSDAVELYLARGNGYQRSASQPTGLWPLALLAADFDGDGATDLVSADYGSSQASLFRGDGRGGLQPAATLAAGLNPAGLASGDLNRDGRLDLLVANAASGEVNVFLGSGSSAFPATRGQDIAVGSNPWALALADFDADAALDLAVAQANFNIAGQPGRVLLYPGNGDGTFAAPTALADGPNPASLVAADFDGDAAPDLAVAFSDAMSTVQPAGGPRADQVVVLLNDGAGNLQPAWQSQGLAHPHHLAAADFDGDGLLDLAAGGANGGSPWESFTALSIMSGNGDGTFGAPVVFGGGSAVRGLAALDANGDGRLDLALAQPGQGLQLYANSPTLAPPVAPAAPEPEPSPAYPQPDKAPNPPPDPAAGAPWQPLVLAGTAQIDLPAGARVQELLFNPAAGLLYALDTAGTIHVLNSASLQPVAGAGAWPVHGFDLLLDETRNRLFVARQDGNETLILDPLTGQQLGKIPLSGNLALDSKRNRLYVIGTGIWLADPDTGRVLGSLPASFQLFSSYVYSPGNLSALFDDVNDRLVTRVTLGGPGSSGSVQHTDVYDGATLALLPVQFSRSYWLPDMLVAEGSGDFYATNTSMDGGVAMLSFFDPAGQLSGEIVGLGRRLLAGAEASPLYLVGRERIATVDAPTRSVVDFTPLPDEATAIASEPGVGRLVLALPDGRLLVYVPGERPAAGPGPAQPSLPADRPVVQLTASSPAAADGPQGQPLLAALVAGPAQSYGLPKELYRSADGGASWQRIDAGLLGAEAAQIVAQPGRGPASALWAVAFHGSQPAGVLRGYGAGDSWRLADLGLRHLRLTDLQLAPGTQETLFAFSSSDRRLYRSDDGGSLWRQVYADVSDFLLSPRFDQDRTLWLVNGNSDTERYAISTDGGDTWQITPTSPWWDESASADFYFSPGWPERGAAYRLAGDQAAVKPAGGANWQPLALPRAKSYFERLSFAFRQDGQFLVFYGDPGSDAAGELYWTDDDGASWQLLLDGKALGERLTALATDRTQFSRTGQLWLGAGSGRVLPYSLDELLAPPPTPSPPPAVTPTPGPPFSDTSPPGKARPDDRLASAWQQAAAELGWGLGPAQTMAMALQPFERGRMIWMSTAVPGAAAFYGPSILALATADGWEAFPDTWREGQPASDPSLAPPAGLSQPIRGFGKVWRERPEVQSRLGWATASEQGMDGLVQAFEHGLLLNVAGQTSVLYERPDGIQMWRPLP